MALSFTPGTTLPVAPSLDDVAKYSQYAVDTYWFEQQEDLGPMHTLLSTLSPNQVIGVLWHFNDQHAYPLVIAGVDYLENAEAARNPDALGEIILTLVRDASLPTIHKVLQWCVAWKCIFHAYYITEVMAILIGRPFTSEKEKHDLLERLVAARFSPALLLDSVVRKCKNRDSRFYVVSQLPNIHFAETILFHYHDKIPQDVKNKALQLVVQFTTLSEFDYLLYLLLVYGGQLDSTKLRSEEQKTKYTAALALAKNPPRTLSFTPDPDIHDDVAPYLGDVDTYEVYAMNKFIHHHQDLKPMQTLLDNINPNRISGVLYSIYTHHNYTLLIDAARFMSRKEKIENQGFLADGFIAIILRYAPLDRIDTVLNFGQVEKSWIHAIMQRPFTSEQDKLNLLKILIESRAVPEATLCHSIIEIRNPHLAEFILVYFHDKITQDDKNHLIRWILCTNKVEFDPDVFPILIFYGAQYDMRYTLDKEQIKRYQAAYAQYIERFQQVSPDIFPEYPAQKVFGDTYLAALVMSYRNPQPDWKKLG